MPSVAQSREVIPVIVTRVTGATATLVNYQVRTIYYVDEKTQIISLFNPFSTGTGWTLYKVYGGFRISYGTG